MINKKQNESFDEYKTRLFENKVAYDLTWTQIAQYLNSCSVETKSADQYRRESYKLGNPSSNKVVCDLKTLQVRLTKERRSLRRYVNGVSQFDIMRELAVECAKELCKSKEDFKLVKNAAESTSGALVISDWHYGIEVKVPVNRYDTEIAKIRVEKLTSKVIDQCKKENIKVLHLINLGDMISGRIHPSINMENMEDVIDQTVNVSYLLIQMFETILKHNISIEYYSCVDNHSRVEPSKEFSIESESFHKFIDAMLQERFRKSDAVVFHKNQFNDIITFAVSGKVISAVHGHKDNINNLVTDLTMLTKIKPDIVLCAHWHHFIANDNNGALLLCNGSLMGTDSYAWDKRLYAEPSQLFFTLTPSGVESINRIVLR